MFLYKKMYINVLQKVAYLDKLNWIILLCITIHIFMC